MNPTQCPVHQMVLDLNQTLSDPELRHARIRRLIEEVHTLVRDIALGQAGERHMGSVMEHVNALRAPESDAFGRKTGEWLAARLDEHHEVFHSHVQTRNCSAGRCDFLTPAPCQMTCPAGIDVPTYVSLIARGMDAEAIEVIRRDNPFPWVCGLVCTRPCEFMCVRGRIDKPVSIKALKAFAAERALSTGTYKNPPRAEKKDRKVCIIGAGPGGMSAAYYLALEGYTVDVLEALPVAGGMLRVGIPRYRLPAEVIDREVGMIQSLGVTFRFNTRFGRDVTLERLRAEGFEAFFFAIGAHTAFKLGIAGEKDYPQVIDAIEFLKKAALGDRQPPGRRVVIIGGGNVAIDAARTCLRLGAEEVILAYRRTRDEMPADVEEVEQAEQEGIHFSMLTVPVRVLGDGQRMTALECLRAELVTQPGSDRKSPRPIEGSEYLIEADALICAIGQRVDATGLTDLKDLSWTRRDTLHVNTVTMSTDAAGIFAAGDAVTGPATVIEAIGGGKRAALAIDRYLRGLPQPKMPPVPVRRQRIACAEASAQEKTAANRPEMPLLNIHRRRTTFQQVELGLDEASVRVEAQRCLRCDICRRCGLCVSICKDKMGIGALELGYLSFDDSTATNLEITQERCIACGACAANCPTGAMQIEDRGGERLLLICGTVLNRQPLVYCRQCGSAMGPARYLEFIRKRVDPTLPAALNNAHLCDACARRKGAGAETGAMPIA